MRTYTPSAKDIEHRWLVVDAAGQPLGRLASRVAVLLRGKHRPIYTPHMDTGDYIIVVNADKVALSGNKAIQKTYFSHSTHPGGGRVQQFRVAFQVKPEWVVRKAIWGMMPHNALGRKMFRKLKVYRGPVHRHHAQQPVSVPVQNIGRTTAGGKA